MEGVSTDVLLCFVVVQRMVRAKQAHLPCEPMGGGMWCLCLLLPVLLVPWFLQVSDLFLILMLYL